MSTFTAPDARTTDLPLFREVQRFTQWWLWIPILAAAGFTWYAAIMQFVFGQPLGTNPPPDALLLILWVIIGAALPAMFLATRLVTEVRADGIYAQYLPFHLRERRFAFDDLAEIHGRTYSPIMDFGGWGLRWGVSGWVYNVRGNKGVQIKTHSGKSLLIGTQRIDEFLDAVERARTMRA